MKKVFTLLLSAGLISSAFAQYKPGNDIDRGYDRNGDIASNSEKYKNEKRFKNENGRNKYNKSYASIQRDAQIARINREYNYKVEGVKNRLYMSRSRKINIINRLQEERRKDIRAVFTRSNNRHSDCDR